MKDLKARVIDVGFLLVVLAVGVGAYHIYQRIQAHNEVDNKLINILSQQEGVQLEQRCTAVGFTKKAE